MGADNFTEASLNLVSTKHKVKNLVRQLLPQKVKDMYRAFVPRNMTEAFSEVYGRDDWDGGSGYGSKPENTVEYRSLLETFLRLHKIGSVVDIGCGDWQFSQLINWQDVKYLGIDTVPAIVAINNHRFGPRFQFEYRDVTRDSLPPGDLVILKDVLQHWPNDIIQAFLPRLEQYRFALITNCGSQKPNLNADIAMTGYRPLDLRLPPFNYPCEELLRYRTSEVPEGELNKLVLLHRSAIL